MTRPTILDNIIKNEAYVFYNNKMDRFHYQTGAHDVYIILFSVGNSSICPHSEEVDFLMACFQEAIRRTYIRYAK